ncbi:MAG: hypothetical protein IPN95_30220 [Bacteroidetes bacterium]|nr:hypothetical protein [Bacteroidota bacterium]
MLDLEFAYFLENQDKWSNEHYGKYVVVVGQTVFGFLMMIGAAQTGKGSPSCWNFPDTTLYTGPESYKQTLITNVTSLDEP